MRLKYHCRGSNCPGHVQTIIDWELTALQHRLWKSRDDYLKGEINKKFLQNPFGAKKAPLIFVGNQEMPQRRHSFTVLGLYYPNLVDIASSNTLF